MKIIDLLNKMANDEEVPEIILFNSYKYKFDEIDNVYRRLNGNSTLGAIVELDIYLNDTVEILEEQKKIPEKINNWTSAVGRVDDSNIEEYMHKLFEQQFILYSKINSIIDYLKSKGE